MNKINLSELKNIEIAILCSINDFCNKNNLKYSLAYGTLLGAIRHKGFIPWDDDIDIIMPRKDYDFFINHFSDKNYEIIHHSVIQNYSYPFAKVYDSNTLLIENNANTSEIGIYVDIFPIDKMPSNRFLRTIKSKYCNFLQNLIRVKNSSIDKERSTKKQLILKCLKMALSPISRFQLIRYLDKVSSSNENSNSEYYADCIWSDARKESLKINIFNDLITKEFEGRNFKVIKCYDLWLSEVYGAYMVIPEKDKQISNHNFNAYQKDSAK